MAEIVIVGAGPAGMSAAIEARKHGATVQVYDNRPEPGGNIYAALLSTRQHRPEILPKLGADYQKGGPLIDAFLGSGAAYHPSSSVWHLEKEGRLAVKDATGARLLQAEKIILATGAQERPLPLPGWTLPGTMGVGGAQILLKTAAVTPDAPVVIVGTGPLPLLYAWQAAQIGAPIAAMIQPATPPRYAAMMRAASGAVSGYRTLAKGGKYLLDRLRRRTPIYRNARDIEITGTDRVEGIRFRTFKAHTLSAKTVLLHDGILPNLHPAAGVGLPLAYSAPQDAWFARPAGQIFVAGDAGGILGAQAAIYSGRRAVQAAFGQAAADADRQLKAETRFRRFIDALYPPSDMAANAPDRVHICRCEQVTAGEIRAAATELGHDPNRIKSTLRAGMGPCQGRMCAQSIQAIIAGQIGASPNEIGIHRIRTPITPITLGDLASLET